jgi:hypothetical protein
VSHALTVALSRHAQSMCLLYYVVLQGADGAFFRSCCNWQLAATTDIHDCILQAAHSKPDKPVMTTT